MTTSVSRTEAAHATRRIRREFLIFLGRITPTDMFWALPASRRTHLRSRWRCPPRAQSGPTFLPSHSSAGTDRFCGNGELHRCVISLCGCLLVRRTRDCRGPSLREPQDHRMGISRYIRPYPNTLEIETYDSGRRPSPRGYGDRSDSHTDRRARP